MLVEEFQDGCLMLDPLWHLNEMISALLSNLSACCLPSSFCPRGYMVLEEDDVWRIPSSCLVLGNLWYANGMILATSESLCCMKPPIKFLLKRIYGLEDVGWRISKWLLSASQSLKWNDYSYCWFSILSEAFHQVSAQEDIYGLKEDVGWRIPRCLFSAWSSLVCE